MPVCNFDGEVIGVAQIMNKRRGHKESSYEFTDTDLKVTNDYNKKFSIIGGLSNNDLLLTSFRSFRGI
jgi:hypothetical protein